MESFAGEICYRLHHMLKNKEEIEGTVHSVFNRVCNITFDNWPIVSLINESLPIKPMAVSLKFIDYISFHKLKILAGQRVIYRNDMLSIPETGFNLNLGSATAIECTPKFDFNTAAISNVRDNIRKFRLTLDMGNSRGLLPVVCDFEELIGEKNKIFPQNPYSQFAFPRIKKLILSINQEDPEQITEAGREAAGIGPGLTPSSDDMLTGLMISFIYAGHYYNWEKGRAQDINSAILKGAKGRTTQLSYEMMSFAVRGEVTKNIHQLMKCIYTNSNEEIFKSILDVMNYGETSGSDLLAGIYIGSKVCMDKIKLRL